MIEGHDMLAEADSLRQLDVQNRCVSEPIEQHSLEVAATSPPSKASPIIYEVGASESVSIEITHSESVVSCSSSIQTTLVESSAAKFLPVFRSGSDTNQGYRRYNEDEHICIDDLSAHLGSLFGCSLPTAFYAVFDGHGGSSASSFIKKNAMKIFFEDANWPQSSDINDEFLEKLDASHRQAFYLADQALAEESTVPDFCGTTALTALLLGRHLTIANAGDCRAVLCRNGIPIQMSNDHRPSYEPERERVEELGGYIEFGYLNGDLAVTRALGDWGMKSRRGSPTPLTGEPEVHQIMLTEDDEFLIVACDGIWDEMSNEYAVSLVRRALMRHDDPQQCARELVDEALSLKSKDNLTAVVVCFTSPSCRELGNLEEEEEEHEEEEHEEEEEEEREKKRFRV